MLPRIFYSPFTCYWSTFCLSIYSLPCLSRRCEWCDQLTSFLSIRSKSFQDVVNEESDVWSYQQYAVVREYYDRPPLCVPFSTIFDIIALVTMLYQWYLRQRYNYANPTQRVFSKFMWRIRRYASFDTRVSCRSNCCATRIGSDLARIRKCLDLRVRSTGSSQSKSQVSWTKIEYRSSNYSCVIIRLGTIVVYRKVDRVKWEPIVYLAKQLHKRTSRSINFAVNFKQQFMTFEMMSVQVSTIVQKTDDHSGFLSSDPTPFQTNVNNVGHLVWILSHPDPVAETLFHPMGSHTVHSRSFSISFVWLVRRTDFGSTLAVGTQFLQIKEGRSMHRYSSYYLEESMSRTNYQIRGKIPNEFFR